MKNGMEFLLTDTVGFIQKLPTTVVRYLHILLINLPPLVQFESLALFILNLTARVKVLMHATPILESS